MSVPVVFPPGLPKPQVATIRSAERRALSPPPTPGTAGPYAKRILQRDRLALQQVAFTFTLRQAAVFEDWWENTVYRGGAWFAAVWPLPQGLITGVRRFVGEPDRDYVAGGFWRVSGVCEVRGRGELPMTPDQLTIYTSWPYPVFAEDAIEASLALPRSGYLMVPPQERFDADLALPVSGTLATILNVYPYAGELFDADLAIPMSGLLPTVLVEYDQPPELIDLDHAIPMSGLLPVVLIVYHPPPETIDIDHAIPQSGSLA